ncbi:MAG: response regulator, partial [Kiritimatiellaeota bacterium]|nr:response regulator [Kiritimatiellota bacterium]
MDWSGLHILAADGERDVTSFIRDVAESFGARCDTAGSGAEAIALTEKNGAYDICFVDHQMPDMDGVEIVRSIKSSGPDNCGCAVLIIPAAVISAVEAEAKKSGIVKFLSKPLFPSDISEIAMGYLGENKRQETEILPDAAGVFEDKHLLLAEDMEINCEIVMALLEPTRINIDCAE